MVYWIKVQDVEEQATVLYDLDQATRIRVSDEALALKQHAIFIVLAGASHWFIRENPAETQAYDLRLEYIQRLNIHE